MPALLINISILFSNLDAASFIKSSISSCLEISNFLTLTESYLFFIAFSFSSLVPVAITLASDSNNFWRIELPIPPVAPVKIIFVFFKFIILIKIF